MNLVETILKGLSGGQAAELGSQVGLSPGETQDAIGAAVPALLAALAGKASTTEGAQKLANSLGKLDPDTISNPFGALGNLGAASKGQDFLGSLLGGGMLQGLTSSIARFTGLDGSIISKLLGFLAPVIMGYIGKQFAGKAVSPQGLSSFFAEQKSSISRAIPSGLSLADVPGLGQVTATARQAADATQQAAGSAIKWVVPVLVLAALALGALYLLGAFNPRQPGPQQHTVLKPPVDPVNIDLPDVKQMGEDLTSMYTSTTQTLAGIKDAATAEAALPKLREVNTKLDAFTTMFNKLPAAARTTITAITGSNFEKLKDSINKVLAIPGVKAKIEPVLTQITDKLSKFGTGA
jgi:hypothetical protein